MTVLSCKQVLQEKDTTDLNAVTDLKFTHKALYDVSCLSEFNKLEKLDLAFNNLSSLEGLKSCVSLKWLSVVQNKLQSLKGIEGLVNLTVLNAGKNKLGSMEEVQTLVTLRALILNDNEIVSLCRLDQMKELNTLVLSRNPIHKIGESLAQVKTLTKLSLSNCQLQSIDSSIKSCTELKELRLAHNEIKTLPSELARNGKILNLDLGNNLIIRWSDLKVLSSLVNLRNLNVLGNPIAAKDMLAKKIKKLVPSLQVFNARPMDKSMKNEDGGSMPLVLKDLKRGHLDDSGDIDAKKDLKRRKHKRNEIAKEHASDQVENSTVTRSKAKKQFSVERESENIVDDKEEANLEKKRKRKKQKTNEHSKESASDSKGDTTITEKESKKKSKVKQDIDDGETPFIDLFTADTSAIDKNRSEKRDADAISGLVTFPKKKKKFMKQSKGSALQLLNPADEVGLGGPSAWGE